MRSKKYADFFLIAVFAVLSVGFGISIWVLPQKDFSEKENRSLTMLSVKDLKELPSGGFSEKLSLFYSDQFPLREQMTNLKAYTELLQGKQENNGILFGKNGYRIARNDTFTPEKSEKNLALYTALSSEAEKRGIPTVFGLVPPTVRVMESYTPGLYRAERAEEEAAYLVSRLPGCVDLCDVLRAAAQSGEQVMYRNDHHWTTHGAYLAYRRIAREMGVEAREEDLFFLQTVSENFSGTSAAKSGIPASHPDSIVLYRYEGDENFQVYYEETGMTESGFYREKALSTHNPYEVFLGGNYARLMITSPSDVPKPRLLLIKDSFANSMIPFLALHFDLDVIDPRYYRFPLPLLLDSADYDLLLFLISSDTISGRT